jgi:uridine phosphorylase
MKKRPKSIHSRFGGQCAPGDIAPYVLVPGSQTRVKRFAAAWDSSRKVAEHFEFLAYTGEMAGVPVSACSTGIGGRSVSIAVDELAELEAHTFIRVGVTGAIQPGVGVGDLVIASGAVRMDKTSEHYVFQEYPAVADFEVVAALRLGYRDGNALHALQSLWPSRRARERRGRRARDRCLQSSGRRKGGSNRSGSRLDTRRLG